MPQYGVLVFMHFCMHVHMRACVCVWLCVHGGGVPRGPASYVTVGCFWLHYLLMSDIELNSKGRRESRYSVSTVEVFAQRNIDFFEGQLSSKQCQLLAKLHSNLSLHVKQETVYIQTGSRERLYNKHHSDETGAGVSGVGLGVTQCLRKWGYCSLLALGWCTALPLCQTVSKWFLFVYRKGEWVWSLHLAAPHPGHTHWLLTRSSPHYNTSDLCELPYTLCPFSLTPLFENDPENPRTHWSFIVTSRFFCQTYKH